ncbi:uncharacterized protein LOC135706739 [Ochlerotatus camptorhynchus]|uniref:uncharacterized protein LOC135706739 n=1 Tax=Ochlerotatus camptorhynchus TaxID=644619 RepID=UPI0031DF1DC4
MAYEMKMADKFDDVVLIDDTNKEIHLIQAKHADTKDEKVKNIDLDALFPTGNSAKRTGDFDLCKYAKSYMTVTGSLELKAFKKMFYIFTNKDLKQTDNEWVKIEEREVNEILRFSGSSAKNLELIPYEKAIKEVLNYINKDFIVIKDAIKEFFHSGTVSQILTHYCTPLKDVMVIDRKKCRFASNFNAEHTNPNVALLYTMLQSDQVDMEKEVTVNNNFLAKDSRNKLLPPFVGEDDIRGFFRDLTLSVGQPNDLQPIIVGELLAWMKTWIQPDILGKLGQKDLDQVYIDLKDYFVKCNEPDNKNSKRFLAKQGIEQCFGQLKRGMETGVIKRVMAEVEEWEFTYINRHIKYEETALEPTGGMHATMERMDIVRESEGKLLSIVKKRSGNDKPYCLCRVYEMPDEKRIKMKEARRRNAIEGINRLDQFLTNYVPEQHQHEVSHRLDRLEKVWNVFETLQEEWMTPKNRCKTTWS